MAGSRDALHPPRADASGMQWVKECWHSASVSTALQKRAPRGWALHALITVGTARTGYGGHCTHWHRPPQRRRLHAAVIQCLPRHALTPAADAAAARRAGTNRH